MLSPGKYHELVPREPEENLRFRLWLLDECRKSARTRRLILRACRDDILFFINAFVWQTNPNMVGEEDGPFITWDAQDEALLYTIHELLSERRMVLWEKSRMQGGTMLALVLDVWLALFHKRKRSIVMSHNEKAVEKAGDEDTLFGKIRFVVDHLPSWMTNKVTSSKGAWQFGETKSQITGTSTTVRSGVGGRATKLTLDELSKYQNAEAILSQTRDTGPALVIGTHYGVGGTFYDLCKRPDIRKVVMHWSKSPFYNRGLYRSGPELSPFERVVDPKNAPPPDYPFVTDGSPHGGPYPGLRSIYYDRLCAERTAREVAIHWDIDPEGAARQFFDPHLIRTLIAKYAVSPTWQGEIEHERDRFSGLRESTGGPLKLWCPFLPGARKGTEKWIAPSLYKVGGDIGAGTGATPSCFAIGDSLTGRKVGEYQFAWLSPERLAPVAVALCRLFSDPAGNPAQLVWDATGPTGEKFGQSVLETGFRQVWWWRDEFKLNKVVSDKPGWYSNASSKMALLSNYEESLRLGQLLNPSENALKECLAFEYSKTGGIEHGESLRNEDPSAGRVNHSDMAIADALMWKLMKEAGAAKPIEERQEAQGYEPYTFGWMMEQEVSRKSFFRR